MTQINFLATSSAFTSLGLAPVSAQATTVAVKVVVADSQPSIGTSGVTLAVNRPAQTFLPVTSSSQVWAASLGSDTYVYAAILTGEGVGGGGGGAAIEPESGPSIKISAFTAAALPAGDNDLFTGLQGGANVNFSRQQIFSSQNAAAASNNSGGYIYGRLGNGDGSGIGGCFGIFAGNGGTTGDGGYFNLRGGEGVTGGFIQLEAGVGRTIGGPTRIYGGAAYANGDGGILRLWGGAGQGSGKIGGDLQLSGGPGQSSASNGRILLQNIPTSDPHVVDAVWSNLGILTLSTG